MNIDFFWTQFIKAIHIIFMVSYFAGIFFIVRIFVYYVEAKHKQEVERDILLSEYRKITKKLWYIIIIPAGSLMLISGILLLVNHDFILLKQPWMHIKLTLLIGLLFYHIWMWKSVQKIMSGTYSSTSLSLRMMNEVATIFLISIVLVVMLKQLFITDFWSILFGLIIFFIIIFLIVKLVNKK